MTAKEHGRQEKRVATEALVRVRDTEREYVFRTRDLSTSGLFLYTKIGHVYPFRVGTGLDLELTGTEPPVSCRAVIVRVVPQSGPEGSDLSSGFGLKIVEIDAANRGRLQTLLERGA